MIKKMTLLLCLAAILISGCVKDDVQPRMLLDDADVYYEYYSDSYGTSIEGEIYNDGETFLNAVELEVRLYDFDGYLVDRDFIWVDTYFNPGQSIPFYFEFFDPYIYNVEVSINGFD